MLKMESTGASAMLVTLLGPSFPKLVIHSPFLGIRQYLISRSHLFKFFLRVRFIRVSIRMVTAAEKRVWSAMQFGKQLENTTTFDLFRDYMETKY